MGISLEGDIKDTYKALHATLTQSPKINKKMLRAAAMAGRGEGKKRVYQSLKRTSGETRKKVSFKMTGNASAYVAVRTAWASNQVFGGEIKPKNREYLSFIVNGQWVRTDRVYIPPKWNFFGEMERYYQSPEPSEKMAMVLSSELEKLWPLGGKS